VTGYGYRVRPGAMDVLLRHLEAGLAEMDARSAAGLAEFERSLQTGMFDSARALKGQMEGPITMASYLFNGDRPLAAVPNCLRAVTAHVVRLAQRRFECFDNSDCRSCFLWMNPVYALPAKRPAARCETVRSPTVSVRCETPAQSLACIAAPHSRLTGCATMVTATCGLGLVSEPAARSSFSLAHAVSALLAGSMRINPRAPTPDGTSDSSATQVWEGRALVTLSRQAGQRQSLYLSRS